MARIWAGIAISIAVHGVLLAMYRQPAAPPAPTPPEPLTVRLRAAPPPVVAPAPPIDTPVPTAQPESAPRKQAKTRTPRRVIAVEPETRQSDQQTYKVEEKPVPEETQKEAPPAAPAFDMNAALKTARKVANAPDPAKAGTALERLPPPPLQTESKFERAIKSAKRRDCKDGVPGGLLAPLFLAMDKKDSGCKW